MLVQKDLLMRQIAQLAASLARAASGKPDETTVLDDDIQTSVGMDLDLAEHLPNVPDARQSLLVGLALARRAHRRVATQDFDAAARAGLAAERFLTDALSRQPDLSTPAVAQARAALATLWE